MDLDELIAAEREHPPKADPKEVRANWKRISASAAAGVPLPVDLSPAAVKVTASSKLAALVASTSAKVTIAVTLVGGSTVAVVANQPDESEPARVETVARVEAPAPEPRPSLEGVPAPVPQAPAERPVLQDEPAPEEEAPAASTEETGGSVAGVRRRKTTTARRPPVEPPPPDSIADELALIQSAQRSLQANDAPSALHSLQTHRERFPSGSLREDRLALRVLALCAAGRHSDGKAARKKFLEAWPKSIYVDRVRQACNDPAAD
jgi:hypothetical protein